MIISGEKNKANRGYLCDWQSNELILTPAVVSQFDDGKKEVCVQQGFKVEAAIKKKNASISVKIQPGLSLV